MTDDRPAGRVARETLDFVWDRLQARLEGLTQEEYLWEPVPAMWSVRRHDDGVWRVDLDRGEPSPAPVTTIAWRLWHVASDCLAGYTERGLGAWPLPGLARQSREWYGEVTEALQALDRSWQAFRSGLADLGEERIWEPLGEQWGPYAEESWLALALHALDEVAHHGGEIALLRDLYTRRSSGNTTA